MGMDTLATVAREHVYPSINSYGTSRYPSNGCFWAWLPQQWLLGGTFTLGTFAIGHIYPRNICQMAHLPQQQLLAETYTTVNLAEVARRHIYSSNSCKYTAHLPQQWLLGTNFFPSNGCQAAHLSYQRLLVGTYTLVTVTYRHLYPRNGFLVAHLPQQRLPSGTFTLATVAGCLTMVASRTFTLATFVRWRSTLTLAMVALDQDLSIIGCLGNIIKKNGFHQQGEGLQALIVLLVIWQFIMTYFYSEKC